DRPTKSKRQGPHQARSDLGSDFVDLTPDDQSLADNGEDLLRSISPRPGSQSSHSHEPSVANDYASLVWASGLSVKSNLDALYKTQGRACRMTMGAPPSTPFEGMNAFLCAPPLDIYIKGEAAKSTRRLLDAGVAFKKVRAFKKRSLIPHSDLCLKALEECGGLNILMDSIPATLLLSQRYKVTIQPRHEASDSWSDSEVHCYTDGSMRHGLSGFGACVFFKGEVSEVLAISSCAAELRRRQLSGRKFIFHSDSQAALRALCRSTASSRPESIPLLARYLKDTGRADLFPPPVRRTALQARPTGPPERHHFDGSLWSPGASGMGGLLRLLAASAGRPLQLSQADSSVTRRMAPPIKSGALAPVSGSRRNTECTTVLAVNVAAGSGSDTSCTSCGQYDSARMMRFASWSYCRCKHFELFHAETSGRSAQLAVMGVLRMLAETFVFNTSMRGFMKLYKTPHRFLRCLWALYAISMLSLWITACYFLIEHYSGFYVTVQQSERIQDITPLPSITLCSQAPMGDHAASLWSNGTIMSPMHLHAAMKRSMRNAFGNGTSRRLSQFYAAKDVFYADKISTYFQNIDITEARRIGMRPEDLLVFCLMKHTPNNNPSVSHDEICRLSVKWVRHPLYLNCYTVTVDQEDTLDVSSVSLILRSGVAQPLPLQGHVFDLFSQSQGLKISLHEQGSHPNIDESAISVGMGRNTEIRYTLVQHRRLNLGNQRSNCLDSEKTAKQRVLRDFDETYNYTFDACMSQAIGQLILGECNCVSAFHLVTQVPTRNTPFCHYHEGENTSSLLSRLDCVRNIKLPHRIAQLRTTTCLRRCNFNQFDMQVSSAQWMPTRWQLKLVLQLAPAWDIMIDHHSSEAEVAEARRRLMSFIDSPNEQRQLLSNTSEPDISRLTLVTVSRATYNTILKTETLQVTLSTLLAQIGGLGSVTIGLTITEQRPTLVGRQRRRRRQFRVVESGGTNPQTPGVGVTYGFGCTCHPVLWIKYQDQLPLIIFSAIYAKLEPN
uniref:RNase H domain-containing protein n=1 Tax=Macrostomum lignano TaxID=282301 RepID=A0A1I8HYZ5_9PLAT